MSDFVALLAAGGVAGILAGLLGIGGGVLLVPVLLILLANSGVPDHVSMHVAVATSMATIIFTAISSAWSHWRQQSVDTTIVKQWAPFVLIGALSGGLIARYINGDALRALFIVLALIIGIRFVLNSSNRNERHIQLSRTQQGATATTIGLLSAWLGIGGGSFSVPVIHALGRTITTAVGTSATIGLCIAIPATTGFIIGGVNVAGRPPASMGFVHLPSAVIIAICAMALAPVGASFAHRINQHLLKRFFGIFLLIAAARMLQKLIT
ncbi:MAG: sulfite exporter TauE/SafE family protein [Woeseiaceae bacterium]